MSTMSQYTEEALDKILKRELIPIVLSLQNKITEDNNAMLQKMRKFNVLKKRMFRGGWNTSAS